MVEEHLSVGLVVERRMLTSAWGGDTWQLHTVLVPAPDVAPWTPLGVDRWYAGEMTVHLYSTDTANYRDNLESATPKLWCVLRRTDADPAIQVAWVTVDPAEGEAATEAGTDIVETITMPASVAAVVANFIAAHHVERPIIKRKRDRAAPEVRSRREGGGS